MNRVRVWDLPTRVFHWGLVICFVCLLVTGQVGGGAMVWHFRLGYCALTLLLFRLVWGFIGGHWSRFHVFLVGPTSLWRYVRGTPEFRKPVGHNPLGSLSVVALLGFSLLQIAAGLFSDDEIATTGPLAKMASSTLVGYATYYHTKVGKVILIVLVQLHIAAMIYYWIRQNDNLVLPMFSGDKRLAEPAVSAQDDTRSRLKAVAVLVLCGVFVASFVEWANHSN